MITPDEPSVNVVNVLYENASNITTDLTNNVNITINIYLNDSDRSIVDTILDKIRPKEINICK